MTILDAIIKDKRKEIELKQTIIPISQLEKTVLFETKTFSLKQNLESSTSGIIAEHKRRSPSKPIIGTLFSVDEVTKGYAFAGVCGISILTDNKYFGGSLDDLILARASVSLPLLRKDFIISEFQILEAKASGADVILLIAAVLTPKEINNFAALAKSLGLEVLLEVHNLLELQQSINQNLDFIGVNNRNLKTFEVNLDYSKQLAAHIPADFLKISESGISEISNINELKNYGYSGFLIGDNFMKTQNPGEAAKEFIKQL